MDEIRDPLDARDPLPDIRPKESTEFLASSSLHDSNFDTLPETNSHFAPEKLA